jgi:hypothetical protein
LTSSRTRIQTAVLAFILLPAAVGVLAVHASQTCERFVRTYVSKPVRNRVSKATNEAWAKWRIAHPNWKPNPNLHRPKYVMTHDEAVNKVEFACTIPTDPSHLDLLFTQADIEPPPVVVNLSPMEGTQIDFPDIVPPEVSEIPPGDIWPPFAPFVPPVFGSLPSSSVPLLPVNPPPPPPVVGAVPEPPSFLLTALGIGTLGFVLRIKGHRTSSCTENS